MADLLLVGKIIDPSGSAIAQALARLEPATITFGAAYQETDTTSLTLTLVSGSIRFLEENLGLFSPAIGITDQHCWTRLRRGHVPGTQQSAPIRWSRIKHSSVGGVTEYSVIIGTHGCEVSPELTNLRRTIRDVLLSGSVRPSFANALKGVMDATTYVVSQRLVPGYYLRLILYATSFFSTGWGTRSLSLGELSTAHGLPVAFNTDDISIGFFVTPPMQLMESILLPVWRHMCRCNLPTGPMSPQPVAVSVLPDELTSSGRSWLPRLHCFLSHDWIDPRLITAWYRWSRCWMGLKLSPHAAVRFYYLAEDFVRGNHTQTDNPLRWDRIILISPGDPNYDPSKPRVMKWDDFVKRLAGDIAAFVDDIRGSGHDVEHAWSISRIVTSRLQHIGVQDAVRKRRPPTQSPGAWAGAVFESTSERITKTVTMEKWEKGKGLVNALWDQIKHDVSCTVLLNYKELETTRGFLCHLSMTFEMFVPLLKGFHLTLASYLQQRDVEGWKYSDKEWKIYLDIKKADGRINAAEHDILGDLVENDNKPPKVIKPVERLYEDLCMLQELFSLETPPIVNDRTRTVHVVHYGFGDASGNGFGSTLETTEGISYHIGVWGSDDESESSNYKEFHNVVEAVEAAAIKGDLKESFLFFFTDNSTVESALYKSNSKSKKLFELIIRFRKVQLKYGLQVSVSHVSGKRMIAQGTDAVSRGSLNEGVAVDTNMLAYIPIHLNAVEDPTPAGLGSIVDHGSGGALDPGRLVHPWS